MGYSQWSTVILTNGRSMVHIDKPPLASRNHSGWFTISYYGGLWIYGFTNTNNGWKWLKMIETGWTFDIKQWIDHVVQLYHHLWNSMCVLLKTVTNSACISPHEPGVIVNMYKPMLISQYHSWLSMIHQKPGVDRQCQLIVGIRPCAVQILIMFCSELLLQIKKIWINDLWLWFHYLSIFELVTS